MDLGQKVSNLCQGVFIAVVCKGTRSVDAIEAACGLSSAEYRPVRCGVQLCDSNTRLLLEFLAFQVPFV